MWVSTILPSSPDEAIRVSEKGEKEVSRTGAVCARQSGYKSGSFPVWVNGTTRNAPPPEAW
jgi:hypothetical protein